MDTLRCQCLPDLLSALAYTFGSQQGSPPGAPYNDIARFLCEQHRNLPDYLRVPMAMASLSFDVLSARPHFFHAASPKLRAHAVHAWKNGRMGFQRDLVRYYESLATFAFHSRAEHADCISDNSPGPELSLPAAGPVPTACEIAVIGSGPGGAITACLLAEAGRDVVLFEEGEHWRPNSCLPFSRDEMLQKYRHSGQTLAFGADKIAYVEGKCVGGGSEINSGLYHRTPDEILDSWRVGFQVEGLSARELQPHFETCERDLSISCIEGAAPEASLRLYAGAQELGWKALEVPRWFLRGTQSVQDARRSMSRTYIPRFLKAGGKLVSGTRVERLRSAGSGWRVVARKAGREPLELRSEHIFVACGAVQTPALLLRSGLGRNIGRSLNLHPTIKMIARFPTQVNSSEMGVPVHQVKEFAPRISLGCSISSRAYMSLGLLEQENASELLRSEWLNMASYYAMITPEGVGRVRNLPGFNSPLTTYQLTPHDRSNLADGLKKLGEVLFAAGAIELFPGLNRAKSIKSPKELAELPRELPSGQANLMTIHLFSSCPIGEDRDLCAADSWGRVHGYENLNVADASLLCSAPGVNPQGTIMALAHRNARAFLNRI